MSEEEAKYFVNAMIPAGSKVIVEYLNKLGRGGNLRLLWSRVKKTRQEGRGKTASGIGSHRCKEVAAQRVGGQHAATIRKFRQLGRQDSAIPVRLLK